MSETSRKAGPVCPRCGQAVRLLPEPKRRLLRGDTHALLLLCPRCRRMEAAARLAQRTRRQK